jgi:hypothetical protein
MVGMAMRRAENPLCPNTGLTLPECSCAGCIREQVERFRPELLDADPTGEITITRSADAPELDAGSRPISP